MRSEKFVVEGVQQDRTALSGSISAYSDATAGDGVVDHVIGAIELDEKHSWLEPPDRQRRRGQASDNVDGVEKRFGQERLSTTRNADV